MQHPSFATVIAISLGLECSLGATAQTLAQAPEQPAQRPLLVGQVSSLAPDLLYKGWRARLLLSQDVHAKRDARIVGTVRDLIVDVDGRAAALIVEGGGATKVPTFVYRVPWNNVDLTPGQDGVQIDLNDAGEKPQYGLFPGTEEVATLPREFRLSEILGDYARLQTGLGYGIVTDVIFTRDDRMSALLVSRDAASGGGTMAFPFYGSAGQWDPGLSYYGLPFVTEGQAREAGLKVEPNRFSDADL